MLKLISLLALAASIVPCLLYFAGLLSHDTVKTVALIAAVVWFIATPLWMSRRLPIDAQEVEI